jgi:hypothetical protein
MEKISWTDDVRNEEVVRWVKEERNILQSTKRRKSNWIGYILRRNCLLNHVVEGKIDGRIELTRRQEWRRKQLLDDLKEKRGYCALKEEAIDCTIWRTHCGRGYGLVVRQTNEWMHSQYSIIYRRGAAEWSLYASSGFQGTETLVNMDDLPMERPGEEKVTVSSPDKWIWCTACGHYFKIM